MTDVSDATGAVHLPGLATTGPLMRSATGQRSFAYRTALLLNELPASIIELDPVSFKRAVK